MTPREAAVGIVVGDHCPWAGIAVARYLHQQSVRAHGIREPEEILVADRDAAGGHVQQGRAQSHGTTVDVRVAGFVLGEKRLTAAVTVGGRIEVPAGIVDRHAPLPVTGAGAEVLGHPPLVRLEVVGERDRLDSHARQERRRRRIGRDGDDAAGAALGAEEELRRVRTRRGGQRRLVEVTALQLKRRGQERAPVVTVVQRGRPRHERLAEDRDLDVHGRRQAGLQQVRRAVGKSDEHARVRRAGAGEREWLRTLRHVETGDLDGP